MIDKFDPKAPEFKKVEWIAVKNISVIWAEAQRPLNDKHAQTIADNLDPEKFGVLIVTKPNGHGIYHAVDGHHRKVAVERCWGKEEKVPCLVLDAEDPKRAAELFDAINSGRRKLQPLELFKVRVTAKSKLEVSVNSIVQKSGFVVGSYGSKSDGNQIACVQALGAVYESFGPEVLERTLQLIIAIWGTADKGAKNSMVVRGIGEFLSEFRTLDWKRLREKMAAKYPSGARLLSAGRTGREIHGGTIPTEIKKLMVVAYNSGTKVAAKKLKEKVE